MDVLRADEPELVLCGLQLAEMLLERASTSFANSFAREGVLHSISTLGNPKASLDFNMRDTRAKQAAETLLAFTPPLATRTGFSEVQERAHELANSHACFKSEASVLPSTHSLRWLSSICMEVLEKKPENSEGEGLGQSDSLLVQMLSVLSTSTGHGNNNSGDRLSTFEFLSSRIVDALLLDMCAFQPQFGLEGVVHGDSTRANLQAVEQQLNSFVASVLTLGGPAEGQLPCLLQMLLDSLAVVERFPLPAAVSCSASGTNGTGEAFSLENSLSSVPHTLNLRFIREEVEEGGKDDREKRLRVADAESLTKVGKGQEEEDEEELFDFSCAVLQVSSFDPLLSFESSIWPKLVHQEVHRLGLGLSARLLRRVGMGATEGKRGEADKASKDERAKVAEGQGPSRMVEPMGRSGGRRLGNKLAEQLKMLEDMKSRRKVKGEETGQVRGCSAG